MASGLRVYIYGMLDAAGVTSHKHLILVIEDEEVMRQVLTDKIRKEGFGVIQAKDGAQGLEKAQMNKPDLILLDNRMPSMGGYEMIRRLRESGPWGEHVPVIFFTNVEIGSKAEKADIEATGALHYLVKSETSLDTAVQKIREVLKVG
jgi:CheY-like chemotaxis protein